MKLAVIDSRMPEALQARLRQAFSVMPLPPEPRLDAPIQAHPDMLIFPYPDGMLIMQQTAERCSTDHEQMFFSESRGFEQIHVQNPDDRQGTIRYPKDCFLNFARCGEYLIGNFAIAPAELQMLVARYKWKMLPVRQGYAKCNCCIVSENALITEDHGIAKVCRGAGIDVLLLQTHAVRLAGYAYGFIGGASCDIYEKNGCRQLLFLGCIEAHPEYTRIFEFCQKHDVTPTSISDEPLTDWGSVFLIP